MTGTTLQLWTATINEEVRHSVCVRDSALGIYNPNQLTWEKLCEYIEPEEAFRLMRREFAGYVLRLDGEHRHVIEFTDVYVAKRFLAFLYWMWNGERLQAYRDCMQYDWSGIMLREAEKNIFTDVKSTADDVVIKWLVHYAGDGPEPTFDAVDKGKVLDEIIAHLDSL